MKLEKKIRITLSVIFFWLITFTVSARQIFWAETDKTEITIEDQILLKLNISNEKGGQPDIPYTDDFSIQFQGSASEITMSNGNISSRETKTYVLKPKKTGLLFIPSISVQIAGKTFSTEKIKITVTEAKKEESSKTKDVFITTQISNNQPYLNEQITYTFRFFRKVQTTNQQLQWPDLKDFWRENMESEKEYEQIINGERYLVTELKKALFPTKSGDLIITPPEFSVDIIYLVDDSWGFSSVLTRKATKNQKIFSEPIKVKVKPYPEANKPLDFSKITGKNLLISQSLSEKKIKAGELLKLKIKFSGEGNINDLNLNKPFFGEKVKVYENKPEQITFIREGKINYEKTFAYDLVPLERNLINIPELTLDYFNPLNQKYEQARAGAIYLEVLPPDNQLKIEQEPKKNEQELRLNDLHDYQKVSKNQGQFPLYLLLILTFFPALVFFLLVKRKTLKLPQKQNYRKKALKELKTLKRKLTETEPELITRDLQIVLNDFLKLKYPSQTEEVSFFLNENNLPQEFERELENLKEQYYFSQFSGKGTNAKNNQELIELTKKLIEKWS